MRRRLALLSLATTALVVVAFLIPLGLLVRRQAADRARVAAERDAQSIAGLIALALTFDTGTGASVAAATGPLDPGHLVVLAGGASLGQPREGQGSLVAAAFESQAAITRLVPGGWEVALPVIGRDTTAVVDVFVTDDELTEGVASSWALLALLGVLLIGAAVGVADRMGAGLVRPIRDLAGAAHRMGEGDLEARVEPADPPEVREVGEAFNRLAQRLGQLLLEQREEMADLSHRLRTPLTSLRLQAERIGTPADRQQVLAQVDRLEQAIDQLILAARSRDGAATGRVVDGRLVLDGTPARRVRLPRLPDHALEDVHLITAVAGIDGTLLRAIRPLKPAGVVVAATGTGNTSADLLEAATELISDGCVVVETTRAPHGTVHPSYGFPGGGAQWQRAGALPSVYDGPKSRVIVALGLAAELDREALAALLWPS